MLKLDKISKIYAGTPALKVLDKVSLTLAAGETIAICGPSGAGKSTLLNIIGCIDRATSGKISLAGQDYADLNIKERAQIRNQEIGFVFQNHLLLPHLTALENVLLPTFINNLPAKQNLEKAQEIIECVGLSIRSDHYPSQLSGGECQRVAVARALINQPKIILADEPTGALDQKLAHDIMDLLKAMNQEFDTAMILVTHAEEYACEMQKIYHIFDGQLGS